MEYIECEKAYFKSYVTDNNFEAYIERKKQPGEWGDDLEIQAMREMYNLPVEIYAYSAEPMKTFHEQLDSQEEPTAVIRISFHGSSHYNSVISVGWKPESCPYEADKAGEIEQEAIKYSLDGKWNNPKESDI